MAETLPYKQKEPTIDRRQLEELFPDELDDFIAECVTKQRELEDLVALAIDIKENGYGVVAE